MVSREFAQQCFVGLLSAGSKFGVEVIAVQALDAAMAFEHAWNERSERETAAPNERPQDIG